VILKIINLAKVGALVFIGYGKLDTRKISYDKAFCNILAFV
jgi:hypothetical protein